MPVVRNRAGRRLHFGPPLKRNELRCTLVAQNPSGQQTPTAQFQEEQKEWDKKWDGNDMITYALIKDSKDISRNGLERAAVYYAMMAWTMEIPLTVKLVKKNQNPKIKIEFTDSQQDDFFKAHPQVLAYTYYPGNEKQGTIKFNDDHQWALSGRKARPSDPWNMVHTLLHELGHCFGLKHATGPHSLNSVMYPYYNGKLKLSAYDKMRIVKKYGNRPWTNYQDYKNFGESLYAMISNIKKD